MNKLCRHVMHETRLIFLRFFNVLIRIGFLDLDQDTSAVPPVSLTSTAEFSRVVADASGSASLPLYTTGGGPSDSLASARVRALALAFTLALTAGEFRTLTPPGLQASLLRVTVSAVGITPSPVREDEDAWFT